MPERDESAERLSNRIVAAREIADTERNWSAARAMSMEGLSSRERIARFAVHQAFYELTEVQGVDATDSEAILGLFADNPEISNATLARIDMNGKWDAADGFERQLLGMLFDTNYRQSIRLIDRESDDAKRTVTIPAGFTKEHNFVALRRKRRLVMASHLDGRKAKRRHVEIDKVSTFALDIAKLGRLDDPAMAEVRLIVAATMFKAVDWGSLRSAQLTLDDTADEAMLDEWRLTHGDKSHSALQDLFNLREAMRRNNLTVDEVRHRAFEVEDPARLRDARGLAYVEEALSERSDLLTPAATTYYIHS